jgi:hypothetical protein
VVLHRPVQQPYRHHHSSVSTAVSRACSSGGAVALCRAVTGSARNHTADVANSRSDYLCAANLRSSYGTPTIMMCVHSGCSFVYRVRLGKRRIDMFVRAVQRVRSGARGMMLEMAYGSRVKTTLDYHASLSGVQACVSFTALTLQTWAGGNTISESTALANSLLPALI